MQKNNFVKITLVTLVVFMVGGLLGFVLGKNPQEQITPVCNIDQQAKPTRTVTETKKFTTCEAGTECRQRVGNVLLAIIGQDGNIIATTTTNENGEAEIAITVPIDPLFSLVPDPALERGFITVISFKENYNETVIFNMAVVPPALEDSDQIIELYSLIPQERNEPYAWVSRSVASSLNNRFYANALVDAVAEALNMKKDWSY